MGLDVVGFSGMGLDVGDSVVAFGTCTSPSLPCPAIVGTILVVEMVTSDRLPSASFSDCLSLLSERASGVGGSS